MKRRKNSHDCYGKRSKREEKTQPSLPILANARASQLAICPLMDIIIENTPYNNRKVTFSRARFLTEAQNPTTVVQRSDSSWAASRHQLINITTPVNQSLDSHFSTSRHLLNKIRTPVNQRQDTRHSSTSIQPQCSIRKEDVNSRSRETVTSWCYEDNVNSKVNYLSDQGKEILVA